MADPVHLTGQSADLVSPGLASNAGQAFELKYLLSRDAAKQIEAWARTHMTPDPHGDAGLYQITSVYSDTQHFDVLHRSPGYRRNKFRLRRYGNERNVYLERKYKRKDRVLKERTPVREEELSLLASEDLSADWLANWFHREIWQRRLRPTCRVSYWRKAFFKPIGDHCIRLTLDHDMVGSPAESWSETSVPDGQILLPDHHMVELKYPVYIPPLFHELLALLPSQMARICKYRLCMEGCGLGPIAVPPVLPNLPLGTDS